MPNFTIEEQFRLKPLREQQPQKLAIPPLTHKFNPPHIFRQMKKIPVNVSVKNLKK
jgi:hypothetical protein